MITKKEINILKILNRSSILFVGRLSTSKMFYNFTHFGQPHKLHNDHDVG